MIDVNGSEIGFRRKLTLQLQTCGSCIFDVKILLSHLCNIETLILVLGVILKTTVQVGSLFI